MRPRLGISTFDTLCLGVNAIVGSGIFMFPGQLAREVGPASILAFAVCALLLVFVALCYAEMGSMFRQSGGPYVYATAAFGPRAGFAVGWISWVTSVFSWAAVANAVSSGLDYLVPVFHQPAVAKVVTLSLILGFGGLNYRGVKLGARAINLFTVGKLLPLFLFVLVGCWFVSPANFHPFWPAGGTGSFPHAVFLSLWALQGFEVTPYPAGESENPQRAVPIAVLGSLATAAILYVLIQTVAVGVHPGLAAGGVDARPLADAAGRFMGHAGGVLLAVGAVISIVGTSAGDALGTPRLLSALAEGGHLPSRLARPHGRFGTPGEAILITTGFTALAAGTLGLTELVDLANLAVILQYIATCGAVFWLRIRRPDLPRLFRLPAARPIALAGCAVSLWLACEVTSHELLIGAAVLAAGLAATFGYRGWMRRRTREGPDTRA